MLRTLIATILLIAVVLAAKEKEDVRTVFKKWAIQFNKQYQSQEQFDLRFSYFQENYNKIQHWNNKQTYGEAKFGLNQFSDMSSKEFREKYTGGYIPKKDAVANKKNIVKSTPSADVPTAWDWRSQGAVTGVKNQEQCGGCWAFASTGLLEGALFIATKQLVGLSEQDLLDCSDAEYNQGCGGGRVDWSMEYVINNKGLDTEASYPFTGDNDTSCSYNAANSAVTITGWNQTAQGDENALMEAVYNHGPMGVAISVDDAFANYQSGVYEDSSCPNDPDDLDHSVLVVGYGTSDNGTDYWIVKNSWGATWGNQGYILMARNQNNMCGIATDAVYSTGAGGPAATKKNNKISKN